MILARVAGTVVASTRADRLNSPVYKLVIPCKTDGTDAGDGIVALDITGAATGQIVMVSQGSSTRQAQGTVNKPVDALVIGIIDMLYENGREAVYNET